MVSMNMGGITKKTMSNKSIKILRRIQRRKNRSRLQISTPFQQTDKANGSNNIFYERAILNSDSTQ